MTGVLNCGYVPLVDSAPLILAHELGFARDEGFELNLLRQPSWSALRDLLALGHLDAAHMLAPMPLAMRMGLSGPQTVIDTPLVLSVNGTVIGVSVRLAETLRQVGWDGAAHPKSFGAVLAQAGPSPLRVGVPFLFSMHRLLFEYMISDLPDNKRPKFQIVPIPPQRMPDAIAQDEIDIICVGEPWGTYAVNKGAAELVLPGSAIWAHAPEKVLGLRRDWLSDHEDRAAGLVRAVYRAAKWADDPNNRPLAGEVLARSEHLNLTDQMIDPALTGRLIPAQGTAPWTVDGFLKFHVGSTNFPWKSLGAWIGQQIAARHGLELNDLIAQGADVFRPDLYRKFLTPAHADMPGASSKIEGSLIHPTAVASTRGEMILGPDGFFDGKIYDFSAGI